jgi:hypothetical protein
LNPKKINVNQPRRLPIYIQGIAIHPRKFISQKMKKGKPQASQPRDLPAGSIGSARRVHKPRKGKGSYTRKPKHGNGGGSGLANSHPRPVVAIERLTEALRNELLEYGHLLDLMRVQQQLVFDENLIGLSENIRTVDKQILNLCTFRQQREYWRAETLCWLEANAELSWANMAELIPEKHRLLIGALAEEINHALETSQKLLCQNQQLNLRAFILR